MIETLTAIIRSNPVKVAGGAIAALGVIVGAVIAVDDRYAHAADVHSATQQISTGLEINRLTSEVSVLELRRAALSDRVFELGQQPRTPANAAVLQRYQSDLQDVTRQQRAKQQLIDQLRTGR